MRPMRGWPLHEELGIEGDAPLERGVERIYFTNSLYGAIDSQFYPLGIEGCMVKHPRRGVLAFAPLHWRGHNANDPVHGGTHEPGAPL